MSEENSDDTDNREKIVHESKFSTCKLEKSELDLTWLGLMQIELASCKLTWTCAVPCSRSVSICHQPFCCSNGTNGWISENPGLNIV